MARSLLMALFTCVARSDIMVLFLRVRSIWYFSDAVTRSKEVVPSAHLTRSQAMVLSRGYDSLPSCGSLHSVRLAPSAWFSLFQDDSFLLIGSLAWFGSFPRIGSLKVDDSLSGDGSLWWSDSLPFEGSLRIDDSFTDCGSLKFTGSLIWHGTLAQCDSFEQLGTLVDHGSLPSLWFSLAM